MVTKRYKVLHVIDHLGGGGAQEALLSLLKYGDRRRFQLEAATLHGRGHYWDRYRSLGVPVYSLSPHKAVPLYIPRLLSLLRREHYDLVHCHLIASNLIAKPLAVLAGTPVRFNHDQTNDIYRQRQKLRQWADRVANAITQHVIAVSTSTRNFLVEVEKVPARKVSVVYNAVDLDHFSPCRDPERRAFLRKKWGLPLDAPVVAGIGRLRSQKNFPLFLTVASEVLRKTPGAHFVMAGDGPDEAVLKNLARDLGVAERVHFLGYVKDIREVYPAVDVFCLTSHFEGTPLTVLEAMAMGVPVVASRVDGTEEVLEDGLDGFLVAPGHRDLFAERVGRLLQDRTLASGMREEAWKKVRTRFSAEEMVHQVEGLYSRYLDRLEMGRRDEL
jgi:glycosyltransferase involved in cell wall biosynthesis